MTKSLRKDSHKKGAASIYVVVFTTILFSVITLSFIRIILSETSQSSNDDLSQSAYDSALAGVEDAKIALNKYYTCLSNGGSDTSCKGSQVFATSCSDYGLSQYLYGYKGEVKIQEKTGGAAGGDTAADQAYTCVILNNVVPDYRSTLSSDTRVRVVPLSLSRGDSSSEPLAASNEIENVGTIKFSWYSQTNGTSFDPDPLPSGSNVSLEKKDNTSTPPVISLTLIRVANEFDISTFSRADGMETSTVILKPSSDGSGNQISPWILYDAANAYKGDSPPNEPITVRCATGSEFACNVELTGLGFSKGENVMLIVSLPYGDMLTDFAITLLDGSNKVINFENAQISVDATGRTSQLVRRVETRLEPSDSYFPYPQYALELTGDGDQNTFRKKFWITFNCWTEGGTCPLNMDY